MGKKLQRAKPFSYEQSKPLRYVLYARKSSEGEDAQEKSIPDQIQYCEEYAERTGLLVVKTVEEKKSAKVSGKRDKFAQILEDITDGKYDGILAYHPDRLARNSLESGMIVDKLDSGVIKDLKFPTLHFTNDASGKLLLNVLFAMSKQYSEHLSESVTRGVTTNFEQGKSSAHKWGYLRDEITGRYEPDPNNFKLIQRGWHMRLEGHTQQEIIDFWLQNDVHRMTKITRKNKRIRKITISKQMASNIFASPFYFGILIQNEQEVDLTKISDFTPMIDEETYNTVQAMGRKKARVPMYSEKKTFYPFRDMILCGVCNNDEMTMRVGKNQSSDGSYGLTYRCDTEWCTRKIKSVRAKFFLNDLYEKLDSMKLTDKEYDEYSKEIDGHTDSNLIKIRTEKRSLEGKRKHLKANVDRLSRQYAALPEDTLEIVRVRLSQDIEELQSSVIDIDGDIERLKKKIVNPAQIKLSKEEFLNLVNTAGDKMRAGTPVEKDILARKLLLNIHMDNERAPSYLWKEPFATLLKIKQINSGAHEKI